MTENDLDEIDLSLLSLIAYLSSYGVRGAQAERFLRERVEIAFDALAEFEDQFSELNSGMLSPRYGKISKEVH